jgi:hypothetical protein
MTDTHHKTYNELLEKTPWEKYGRGRDPRCEDCMVHAGYEASAVIGGNKKFGDTWKMLKWTLSGKMGGILKNAKDAPSATKSGNGNGSGKGNSHSNGDGAVHVPPPTQGNEAFRIL